MKKILIVIIVVLAVSYSALMVNYQINRNAEYIYDANGSIDAIKYNDTIYEPIDKVSFPYELVVDANATQNGKVNYISRSDYRDVFLPWGDHFVYHSDEFDSQRAFIRVFPYNGLYLKDGFVYPTIYQNKVNEIWMSLSSNDKDNIKDKEIVNKIVKCAKSDGKIELDKEIYDYIKKYSADHHCLWLKYEGYPLVEEFHIEETEDGRYIIDQYTPEEYDTIYWEEEAHQ